MVFGEAHLQFSQHTRAGGGQLFSEFIATFGLLCVVWGCARLRSEAVPVAVGLQIAGAYWFTASTSFNRWKGSVDRRGQSAILDNGADKRLCFVAAEAAALAQDRRWIWGRRTAGLDRRPPSICPAVGRASLPRAQRSTGEIPIYEKYGMHSGDDLANI